MDKKLMKRIADRYDRAVQEQATRGKKYRFRPGRNVIRILPAVGEMEFPWKESGMHIYAWDDRKPCFFSVDIYTCRAFDFQAPVDYTKQFFGDDLIEVVWKE